MNATGLDVFDKTLQTTNIWLDEIMDEIGPDRQVAWHVLGAVLHALRDRMQPDLAAHLGSQLPILVRGAFYDQYQPSKAPEKMRSLDEFLAKIKAELEFTRPVDSKMHSGSCPRYSPITSEKDRCTRSGNPCRAR